jgi:hypothetical protein
MPPAPRAAGSPMHLPVQGLVYTTALKLVRELAMRAKRNLGDGAGNAAAAAAAKAPLRTLQVSH